jgi:hypothetical protein
MRPALIRRELDRFIAGSQGFIDTAESKQRFAAIDVRPDMFRPKLDSTIGGGQSFIEAAELEQRLAASTMSKDIIRSKLDCTIGSSQSFVDAAKFTQIDAPNDVSKAIRLKPSRNIDGGHGVANGAPKTVIRRKLDGTIGGGQGFTEVRPYC